MKRTDFDSRIPIYQQVIDYIEELIVGKDLRPGQELPSRREFARILNINPNTVQRAFSEMEKNKWLYTDAGRPSRLTEDTQVLQTIRMNWINRALKEFVDALETVDLSAEEAQKLIQIEMQNRKDTQNDRSD